MFRVKRETRTVLWVLGGVASLGCLGTAALVALLVTSTTPLLGSDGAWGPDAVPERELKRVFGCQLPAKPVHYSSRQLGFQDAFFEVVVQLPSGSAEAFLSSNGLSRGPAAVLDDEVRTLIDATVPGSPALDAVQLQLPEAFTADGGPLNLHRNGELLEGPGGETWVHLVAFET